MSDNHYLMEQYLNYCKHQKGLDPKTIKAYYLDLTQFFTIIGAVDISQVTPRHIEAYVSTLHSLYKPKTAKRKIASVKAFFIHLEYHEIISQNPWRKVRCKFREPVVLPKVIPLHILKQLLRTVYTQIREAKTPYRRRNALRDAAVCELLFVTGIRIFELCTLTPSEVNLDNGTILVHGKGRKDRFLQIGSPQVLDILKKYRNEYCEEISSCNHFFANQSGHPLTDQAVRRMLNHYTALASIDLHITPHMFRHTFATSLLDADVDIRYIQEMLGHSSIHTTEIYTHVSSEKQRVILCTKHPRNRFEF